jgi:hypothetical protein
VLLQPGTVQKLSSTTDLPRPNQLFMVFLYTFLCFSLPFAVRSFNYFFFNFSSTSSFVTLISTQSTSIYLHHAYVMSVANLDYFAGFRLAALLSAQGSASELSAVYDINNLTCVFSYNYLYFKYFFDRWVT